MTKKGPKASWQWTKVKKGDFKNEPVVVRPAFRYKGVGQERCRKWTRGFYSPTGAGMTIGIVKLKFENRTQSRLKSEPVLYSAFSMLPSDLLGLERSMQSWSSNVVQLPFGFKIRVHSSPSCTRCIASPIVQTSAYTCTKATWKDKPTDRCYALESIKNHKFK